MCLGARDIRGKHPGLAALTPSFAKLRNWQAAGDDQLCIAATVMCRRTLTAYLGQVTASTGMNAPQFSRGSLHSYR